MKATFMEFSNSSQWVMGKCGDYLFNAKLYDEGSIFGIKNGRVSKLSIINAIGKTVVNYDRGWDIKPKGKDSNAAFKAIMELLETSPRRFAGLK